MIEQGKFFSKYEVFEPAKTFKFIIKMFYLQAKVINSEIEFKSFKKLNLPSNASLIESEQIELPKYLRGD